MAWAPEMFHTGLVNDQVPGDIVECGAWRGGASIFSKGVVDVLDPTGGRKILVADTFVGFPAADKNDGVDQCINQIVEAPVSATDAPDSLIDLCTGVDTDGWAYQNFHVGGSDAVVATFKRYGVFDDKVVIAAGLFNETLPILPTEQIALLRMDCDMYRSTIDALLNLYDKVAIGAQINR